MSSPIWKERGWFKRQRLYRRRYVLALRKEGITWPPRVGQMVCDCRFEHRRVVSINVKWDDVILEDGFSCSLDHCIDPVDHTKAEHPRIAAEFGSPWPEGEKVAQ